MVVVAIVLVEAELFKEFPNTAGLIDRNGIILYTQDQSYIGKDYFGNEFQSIIPIGIRNDFNTIIEHSLEGNTGLEDITIEQGNTSTVAYNPVVVNGDHIWTLYIVSPHQLSQANEQLKVHDKMQKEFINVASHEMKTPTQAIIGYSDLMQKHPDKREEMLKAISRNAVRLQRLTNDILDVTRIESQTLNLYKEKFNLSDLIANIVEDHRSRVEKENSMVKLLYDSKYNSEDSHIVEADKDRITQVISNVLNNAIKFVSNQKEGGGTVSVTLEKNHNNREEVIVNIRDNGEGIHQEILPRLFTKFASKSFSGTGLGLYISKSIVEAHGGKMWAQNNSDGQGATFTFTLPLNNNIKTDQQQPDNASIFTMGLEDGGFEVDTFMDPLLALSSFEESKRRKYDLLILDIKMPDMDGFELYEQIKKIDSKVKVCFLTAFGEGYTEEFKKRFPSSSIGVGFIRKPIRVDDLVKKVNEMMLT